MKNVLGYIHSIESLGGADGPGVRTVVFMQGCPLRCAYCHNPDTWLFNMGEKLSPENLFERISRYKPYYGTEGGVTVSGGEPMAQPVFLREFFKLCKNAGINTAVDTSGSLLNNDVKAALEFTDLVLLDVKHTKPEKYKDLTGWDFSRFTAFLDYCTSIKKPLWLRQVIVPGITDNEENIKALARLAKKSGALKVELLPYHDMGVYKWKELGLDYKLDHIRPPSEGEMEKLYDLLQNHWISSKIP